MYRTDFWTLWEKARVGCFERTELKHVYYLWWNRSPTQVGCMRQVLRPGALGRPRGIGWRGRWEGGSGWGIHVTPWLTHVNVWANTLKCCEVISLQLIKINGKKISEIYYSFLGEGKKKITWKNLKQTLLLSLSCPVVSDFFVTPWIGLLQAGILESYNFLLQGRRTQGSNLHLQFTSHALQANSLPLSHQGSPKQVLKAT